MKEEKNTNAAFLHNFIAHYYHQQQQHRRLNDILYDNYQIYDDMVDIAASHKYVFSRKHNYITSSPCFIMACILYYMLATHPNALYCQAICIMRNEK